MKRAKVFTCLKSLPADIMFLQDTHIAHKSKGRLKVREDQIYQACFSMKAKGGTILFRTKMSLNSFLNY